MGAVAGVACAQCQEDEAKAATELDERLLLSMDAAKVLDPANPSDLVGMDRQTRSAKLDEFSSKIGGVGIGAMRDTYQIGAVADTEPLPEDEKMRQQRITELRQSLNPNIR
eukprot:gnl/TRDRNA2_/TRDRNA2_167707_c7_seq1.p1 gnl/TRDRNA2_/TRDRNA2_167707_c7~~gnl/TRDRNA2_/TRDRNA2_167707_c7_seq1.p1  ORF type:complete len:122 (+),score=19.87 gnl/TRDRNA2_/TRDRNA2_167707_c7_seq1:35-367(+)